MSVSPYSDYTDCGVGWLGDIPNHWTVSRIKFFGKIRYGVGEPPEYRSQGVPLIRATNVKSGKISDIGLVHVDPNDIPKNRIVWLKEGDVIVVRSGAYTGDSSIVPKGYAGSIAGFDMVFSPKGCEPRFIAHSLLSRYIREHQFDLLRLRAAQPHLNAEEFGDCFVVVPPSEEQSAIANFLDRETAKIDTLVDKQKQLIKLLEEKRQAVIFHAVTKGLNPDVRMKDSMVEWLGDVPEHWEVMRVGQLFSESKESGEDELPVLSVSIHHGVSEKELSSEERDRKVSHIEDKTKYKRVRPSDLTYNMMRAWQGGFGAVVVDGLVSPAYVVARPRTNTDTMYFEKLLRTPSAITEMHRFSKGITDFRLRLYWDEFKGLWLVVPPADEIRQIVEFIKNQQQGFDELLSASKGFIGLLNERRTALVSAAVTGKIDVRNAV